MSRGRILLLQRQLEGGPRVSRYNDFTGYDKLDQQDVSAIAAMAVKLGGPRL